MKVSRSLAAILKSVTEEEKMKTLCILPAIAFAIAGLMPSTGRAQGFIDFGCGTLERDVEGCLLFVPDQFIGRWHLDNNGDFVEGDHIRVIGFIYSCYSVCFANGCITTSSLDSCAAISCSCPCAGDPACDGIRCDILDVATVVNAAFRGGPVVSDPGCPRSRSDFDCNGSTDVADVAAVIDVAFRGADPQTRFCNPCS